MSYKKFKGQVYLLTDKLEIFVRVLAWGKATK